MPSILLAPDSALNTILLASMGLVAFLVIGLIVVTQVKKRMHASDQDSPASTGFTLSDLRELHETGQMSDEEFERAKGRVIAAARRAADRSASEVRPRGPDLNLPK